MPVTVPRGPQPDADAGVREFASALENFAADHPGAAVEVYRHGEYTVRARVVWDGFRGRSWADRHTQVWAYLEPMSEEVLSELSTLLLLSPDEQAESPGSVRFDHPAPAAL